MVHLLDLWNRLTLQDFWIGDSDGSGGADIHFSEEWIERNHNINRISDVFMLIKIAMVNIAVLPCYIPFVGYRNMAKDDQLHSIVSKVSTAEILLICEHG